MNVSDDGMTWTVTSPRRCNIYGRGASDAEDVGMYLQHDVGDTSSVNDFTMLKEAKALDDTTVEFDLSRPYSIWPYTMAITRDPSARACLWTELRFKSDRLRPLYYETVG